MVTTYFRFPTSKTIYRVVNVREFMGLDGMLCDAITEHGHPSIEVVLRHHMHEAEDATAEEWTAAEALAHKVQAKAKAKADRIAREEAERYGLKVVASGRYRGVDISVVIVRVTKTRYVDANGRQWKRLRNGIGVDGQQVGDFSRWDIRPRLRAATIDVIEAACGGAETFDFIKTGKQREIDAR